MQPFKTSVLQAREHVRDYVTAPHIIVNPDPFLMAVIPNSAVAHGKGRFIIDVWDEPGFGIDKMIVPSA